MLVIRNDPVRPLEHCLSHKGTDGLAVERGCPLDPVLRPIVATYLEPLSLLSWLSRHHSHPVIQLDLYRTPVWSTRQHDSLRSSGRTSECPAGSERAVRERNGWCFARSALECGVKRRFGFPGDWRKLIDNPKRRFSPHFLPCAGTRPARRFAPGSVWRGVRQNPRRTISHTYRSPAAPSRHKPVSTEQLEDGQLTHQNRAR